MARYTGSVCRFCRRDGLKLFLKGDRCYTEKCAFERRSYAPGDHGQVRRKQASDYGLQLREKQKLKRMYGLAEKQFKGTFMRADRQKGITGANLVVLLERRLDNVLYRLGFASSRAEARQLISHRHFQVGGRTVSIPSYVVKVGEEIELREKSRNIEKIKESLEMVARRGLPAWLSLDKGRFTGKVLALPTREDITMPMNEQLVVELYSK